MSNDSTPLRILIVDAIGVRAEAVARALQASGDQIVGIIDPDSDMPKVVEGLDPDAIIIDLDTPTQATLDQISEISRSSPKPIVMFAHNQDEGKIQAAVRAGVSSYVVDGLSDERIKSVLQVSIARFNQFEDLKKELARSKEDVEDKKVVERAKGILMHQRGCGEEEAHKLLQKLAMDRRKKITEVANDVLAVAEVFQPVKST